MKLIKKLARFFYLPRMKLNASAKMGKIILNTHETKPLTSIYSIKINSMDGNEILLEHFKGKKMLIVNTASDCGYTPQYAQLQELYSKFANILVVVGVPSNDFGQQEPLDDAGVKQFCQIRYGINFPMTKKTNVIGPNQNALYNWLTDKSKNGWNSQKPEWNFYKYLVNENGVLTGVFSQHVEPCAEEVIKLLGN